MNRKTLLILAALVAVLLFRSIQTEAQGAPYDGLTLLGVGHHFVDEGDATLDLMGFNTKYKEDVVGMYFASGGRSVHFYMNAAVWDKLKKQLIQSRDAWQTLDARSFEGAGSVQGYTIAGKRATLRLGMQGATALQPKQLLLIASSSAAPDQQIVISLLGDQVTDLVNDFQKIDELLQATR